jgi:hypothetical protein
LRLGNLCGERYFLGETVAYRSAYFNGGFFGQHAVAFGTIGAH